MVEDPTEYSPEFQDEYRRLWHEAAGERNRLRVLLEDALAEIERLQRALEAAEREYSL
jgi:hypothetical protein